MRFTIILIYLFFCGRLLAQPVKDSIPPEVVQKHLLFLASDSLKGRGNYTADLHTAAAYIKNEFNKYGLAYLPALPGYYHPFTTKSVRQKALLPDTAGTYNARNILLNIVGVLPGKAAANEVVVFAAHYDHLGGSATKKGDYIYNGANDNASGTAAVLALAQYYAGRNDNARTIMFCLFAGEELGLLGSDVFVKLLQPDAVKAVINIEMIGRTNAVGKKSVFITGAEHSNFMAIFKKNTAATGIAVVKEPKPGQLLFTRSDNYPFALKGIPAHSIMSSDDEDPCYHQVCDDVAGIDLENMTLLIQAIAEGCQPIIDGTDTPGRIKGLY